MASRALPWILALSLLLVSPATLGAAPALPPVADVLERLRGLETARLRGTADAEARALEEQVRARPREVMPRVYKAWLGFPSDTCWNELKALSTLHPENPWPHLGMGLIYVRWGLLEEARAPLAAALREAPGFAPALWGEALRLRAAGHLPEAEARLREALAKLDAPQVRTDLGLLLATRPGREAEARELLTRSVADWPEQPEALEVLARLAREANDLRAAAEVGERRLALRPHDREGHRLQAEAWRGLGEPERAAGALERYLALGGAQPAALSSLARLYAQLGRPAEEERVLGRLVAVELKDPEPVLRLAELAEARADLPAVEALLGRAVERAPARSDLHLRQARWLARQERWRDALEAYRAALAAPERGGPEAQGEAAALVKRLRLPATPAQGSADRIYSRVSLGLVALYMERLKERPDLRGILKVRVQVDEAGRATRVAVVYDSLGDALLAGHAYFAFLDARYPPGPDTPVFQYVFTPPKGR